MNKKSLFLGILLSLMCVGIVSGSLYAEKIPDPNRFISIEPLWSVKLEKVDGGVITISLLEFVWEQEDGQGSTTMFYLDDGADEYIADKGSFRYAQESTFQCSSDEDYQSCVSGCGNDESCIDQCTRDYDCKTTVSCTEKAPDASCGTTHAFATFGNNIADLVFNPSTGELESGEFNKIKTTKINENGYLSVRRLSI